MGHRAPPRVEVVAAPRAYEAGGGVGGIVKLAEKLAESRRSVDGLDAALVVLLAERFRITEKVGILKARAGLAPEDKDRERQMLGRYRLLAEQHRVDEKVVLDVMRRIVHQVKVRHQRLQDGGN